MRNLTFILILLDGLAFGQNTFNHRLDFGYPPAILSGIIATDSCYYGIGIVQDTIPSYPVASLFTKIDLDGNPVITKILSSSSKWHYTREFAFVETHDNNLAVSGIMLDSIRRVLLVKYNTAGDTLFTKTYLHPSYPVETFVYIHNLILNDDGGFLIVGTLSFPYGASNNNDILLIRIDSVGNEVFKKSYGITNQTDLGRTVLKSGDGYLIGGLRNNTNLTTENYTFQTQIVKTDSLGNLEWEYLTPTSIGLRDAANDMVLLDDGSLVIASGIGHEIERSSVNEVHFDKMIFKLSPDLEIEWEVAFVDPQLTSSSKTTKLLNLSDGSGFVLAGVASSEQLPPPVLGANRGWITKVDHEGNSIWKRQYVYIDDSPSDHVIYDMKETPDGGFILCGEARDLGIGAEYPQQAWLLKLDRYGCLVPGCHLLDSSEEEKKESIRFSIYPNPTLDYLNFQILGNPLSRNGQVNIADATGRIIKSFPLVGYQNETFILPVGDWPNGIYFLQYVVDGQIANAEKFIIAK